MTASMISTPTPAAVQLPAKSKTPEPERVQHESIDSTTTIVTESTSIVTNGVATVATTNGTTPREIEQVATAAIDEIVAAATDAVLQKSASIDRDSIERDVEIVEAEQDVEPQTVEQEIVVVEPVAPQQSVAKPTIKAVSDLSAGGNSLNDSTDNGDLMTGE